MWWITGANGLLGKELCEFLKAGNIEFVSSDMDVDIRSDKKICSFLRDKTIHGIVNCAAFTNVEACEVAQEELMNINIVGPFNLAVNAQRLGVPLIHFSTDYVFDGNSKRAYTEDSRVHPLNKYGLSKWYGDRHIVQQCQKHFIFRISWLYGRHGGNFVDKVIDRILMGGELNIVDDQVGSLTSATDLCRLVLGVISSTPTQYGLYNFSGVGPASWYEVACYISKVLFSMGNIAKEPIINPCTSWSINQKAKRPSMSYLDKKKIEDVLGVAPIEWHDSLMGYIINKFESIHRLIF